MSGQQVEVPEIEIEDSVEILGEDVDDTVLLVIDMQNDFVHPEGVLYNPKAEETVSDIQDIISRVRDFGVDVWFTRDTHEEESPEFEIFPEHCVGGTWGHEIVSELSPKDEDKIFDKPRFDAFYGTDLDHQLDAHGKENILIVGTVANICVLYTASSAGLRYKNVSLIKDGISALTDFDYYASLRQAQFVFGATISENVQMQTLKAEVV